MKVGLIAVDGHNGFPNLALMRLSAWHKARGDQVEWWDGFTRYGRVYKSKVFTFTPDMDTVIRADEIITGGTGYKNYGSLPPEIEATPPDYSLYPSWDKAVGFLTRGCIRNCEWCLVPRKEGNIRPAATWEEIRRPDSREIVFLDNNVLASDHGLEQIDRMGGEPVWVDFNQGLDARLITPETAGMLARLRWIRFIRLSCDTSAMLPVIRQATFERQVNALIPWPDQETTADLFAFGQELGEDSEYGSAQAILNSLSFISRHFDAEITQGVYEIIQHGSALPDEMVAAAVHMAIRNCSPQEMAQAANRGELMCLHTPKDAEELSPLAVCTVHENGQSLTRYTTHFGSFDPKAALRLARKYAHERKIPVTDALLSLTVDLRLDSDSGARKILAHSDEAMTEMLDSCFDRCPVLAARLTFDADNDHVAVEYNPLWLELRQQQEPTQTGVEQTMG